MTLTEKASYLKGLLEGMNIDEKSENGKIFTAIADILSDLTVSVTDLEDQTAIMGEELDLIEESLDEIDEVIDDIDETLDDIIEYDDEEDDECECHHGHHHSCGCHDDEEEYDDDYEFDDEEFYQVVCPTCEEIINIDEEVLKKGEIKCPACGEELEFQYRVNQLTDYTVNSVP